MVTKSQIKNPGAKAWHDIERALIGRYTFVGWLGAGAFGDVLEARQTSTGQSVAIKVLRVREHENTSRRFVREMRACAALHHPSIVRVLDAGGDEESDHPLYTVFEYVPGETLAGRLAKEEMLPVDEALGLMMQVLDALQCAHSAGIVHRDLKPANIMVTETVGGLQAKILDFGVAGFVDNARQSFNVRLTRSDERMGTPAYCAPEQLRGEPTTVRVDYYAWGLVLLECLTGLSAFGARTLPEVLHAQFSKDPVPLPSILAEHRMGELLRWVLEKDPARRASDARLILERIKQIDARDLVDGSGFLRLASAASSGAPQLPPTETALLTHPASERCPTTALCCRVALLQPVSQPDEEALDEWLNDLRDLVTQTAQNHGAISVGCGGGELLFYFSVGSGEEASARRAIRAAIDIRDHCVRRCSVMRVRLGWEVGVRLGVHSGMLTMTVQERQPIAGLGSTSLVASRLSQLCAPGDIAVSEAALASVPEFVSVERVLADQRGAWDPWYRVADFDLSAPSSHRPSSDATPTLGRRALLKRLDLAWKDSTEGLPQCIVLAGVPGIGKTHLARAWCARLATLGASVLESHCFPETEGNALNPILRLLRDRLGMAGSEPEEESRILEDFLVKESIDPLSAMPLLSAWLGLSGTKWPELSVSPMKRRQMFLELMVRLVKCLISGPTVLFVEDLHWADPTTLEWMCKLCQTRFDNRLVLLCTTRTSDTPAVRQVKSTTVQGEFLGALLKLPGALSIDVAPLDESAARELLTSVWDSQKPNEKLLTVLVERGAGVPLFLLELARYGEALGDAVPASIKELLIARIDQLGRAKETAQLAAIIDPEFDYELLEELSQRREGLLGDINHLEAAGILRRAADGRYSFTHALLRECAHLSMPKRDRQRLHTGVIAALYRRYPDLKASKPWLLALHHKDAEQWDEALEAGEAAATGALMRFDNLEALGYIQELKGRRGRTPATAGWLRHVVEESQRAQIELRLLALETTALMMTRGWADIELNEACRRASELFDYAPVESTIQLRYVLAQFYFNRGLVIDEQTGRDRARPYIDDLIQSADRAGVKPLVKLGRMMLGAWHLFHGSVETSLQTLRLVDSSGAAEDAWKYGFDAQIGARSVEGMARWFQGDPEVRAFSDETMRMAKALEHPATYGIAQLYRASLDQLMGDRSATSEVCADLLALCERHGLQGYPGYALILSGWANNEPAAAHSAREALTFMGQRLTEAYYGALIAEAELKSADFAGAWRRLLLLEETARSSGESFYLPRILFLKARTAKHVGIGEEEADSFVTEALVMAADQGARGMCASVVRDYRSDLEALPAASRAKRKERLLNALKSSNLAAMGALLRELA